VGGGVGGGGAVRQSRVTLFLVEQGSPAAAAAAGGSSGTAATIAMAWRQPAGARRNETCDTPAQLIVALTTNTYILPLCYHGFCFVIEGR
jgi:hypothetical protein